MFNLIKIKNFYSLKDIIKRMKQATDCKEIFANLMSDKKNKATQ